jgi:hypothetical protein
MTSSFPTGFELDTRTLDGSGGESLCFVPETEPYGTNVIGIVVENLSVICGFIRGRESRESMTARSTSPNKKPPQSHALWKS